MVLALGALPPITTVLLWSAAAVGPTTTMPWFTSVIALPVMARLFVPPNAPVAVAAELTLRPGLPEVIGSSSEATQLPLVARIGCVHLPTFRPAFEKAQHFDASGAEDFTALAEQYRGYAQDTLSAIEQSELPIVVAGDFNVPADSRFYQNYWSSFQNALSLAGFGLCYTKYTRLHGVRIDHVLADHHWKVHSAQVGPGLGGDHRPVLVELRLIQKQSLAN